MESNRFAWVLPAEIEAPANLVREILKAAMRYTVVQEHHSSEWHLTSHFSLSDVNVVGFLNLTLCKVNMPSVTRTASVGEGPPNPVSFRDHLRENTTIFSEHHAGCMLNAYVLYWYCEQFISKRLAYIRTEELEIFDIFVVELGGKNFYS